MTNDQHKLAFFRQSGWMMFATVVGGVLMWAVHKIAAQLPIAEYGIFTTLLQILNLMGIPAAGLQTVFAQQAAAAVTEERQRQLAGTLFGVLRGTFLIWLCIAVVSLIFKRDLLIQLKIDNPSALWITVFIGLAALWFPIVQGLLQGRQDFLWMGWSLIANGAGRFLSVAVIVLVLGGLAAGAMTGALLGMIVAIGLGAWQIRPLCRQSRLPFAWRPWLARVVPLTLGTGTCMFMLSADMIIVQSHFDKNTTGLYAAAGMIGRGLVFFTIPLTAVMFPKIVRSAARAEKTDVLALALGATALTGGMAALGCTLFPWLPLRIIYKASFLSIAPLVPWFAWGMLPLTLANVLVSNLLARSQFAAVPWLMLVAVAYGVALYYCPHSFTAVAQTLGVFNLILLAVAAWFTWMV
ncbi:MAG: hypothetical protein M1608_15830, partial [Candidatus Omnitrophica bacterium]|nr:hypothetical protein [Candidatus Omnitrophota bacterium]